jgi:hypothetical protein
MPRMKKLHGASPHGHITAGRSFGRLKSVFSSVALAGTASAAARSILGTGSAIDVGLPGS